VKTRTVTDTLGQGIGRAEHVTRVEGNESRLLQNVGGDRRAEVKEEKSMMEGANLDR
jgi:hypothetical protein